MKVLAVVPARGGSTRVPRKNLAVVGGATLVRRALETTVAADCFEAVALSSDDEEILAQADGLDVHALRRPPELSTADAPTYGAVRHALDVLEGGEARFDAVGVVQCTSPFTAAADLAGAVELLERTGAPSVVSVVRVDPGRHPLKLKVLDEQGRLHPYVAEDALTPSQDLPPLWVRNGSVYLSLRSVLDRGTLLDPDDVRGYEMPPERSLDVDTPLDLAFARFLAAGGAAGARR